jgi:hypothetical protein
MIGDHFGDHPNQHVGDHTRNHRQNKPSTCGDHFGDHRGPAAAGLGTGPPFLERGPVPPEPEPNAVARHDWHEHAECANAEHAYVEFFAGRDRSAAAAKQRRTERALRVARTRQ